MIISFADRCSCFSLVCLHDSACVSVWASVCISVCVSICVSVWASVCVYVCLSVYVYVCSEDNVPTNDILLFMNHCSEVSKDLLNVHDVSLKETIINHTAGHSKQPATDLEVHRKAAVVKTVYR